MARASSTRNVLLDYSTRVRWRAAGEDVWQELETTCYFGQLHGAEFGPLTADVELRLGDEMTFHAVHVR